MNRFKFLFWSVFLASVAVVFIGREYLLDTFSKTELLLPIVLVSALVDSINPCAFSVLLLTVGFLISIGKDKKRVMLIGGSFIFGLFVVYVLIGLGILQVLDFFGAPHFMSRIGALMLITLGLVGLASEVFVDFPVKFKIPTFTHGGIAKLIDLGSMPASFFMGILVGLFEFPCTGGPYLAVLGLLHDSFNYAPGLVYLLIYNLVFISPLIAILFIVGDQSLVDRISVLRDSGKFDFKLWTSILMILLGVLIIFI